MQMHLLNVCETLLVAMVVLVFFWIYRKRQSTCTWNWIAGWMFVAVHFLILALMPSKAGVLLNIFDVASVATLIIPGAFFFLATIELGESLHTQRRMAFLLAFPGVLYMAAVDFYPRTWLLVLALALVAAGMAVAWNRYFRPRPYAVLLMLLPGSIAFGSALYCVLHGNIGYPVVLGLTIIYCFTGLAYWRRFHRASPGVLIAVFGFLSWGGIFMAADLIEFLHPGLIPESSALWNVPKYFVAAAMILTLLEEEIHSAQRLMQRYQVQFDRSLCGVYRCSSDGRLLECNAAFALIFRSSREKLLGLNIAKLLAGDDAVCELIERLGEQPNVVGMEFNVTTADGEHRTLIGNASLAGDLPGEPGEIQGMVLDITEFKALHEKIRESQKLEALGLLAGGVAHDFNNLLMVISGHIELLELIVGSDSESRSILDAVKSATQRGASITGQLLAFSRKRPAEARLLDINFLLKQSRNLLTPAVGEKIKLQVRTAPGRLDVLADENQLILALLNLVINARDAMPAGGEVVLESSTVEFDEGLAKVHGLKSAGRYVCIGVSDTGCGIPSEIKARVFEPFFTTKPQGKGTGLGLSICYGIVQQHKGTITIASAPGVGTTMRFYLPMADDESVAASAVRPAEADVSGARVLLVDDEDQLRTPACVYFRQAGFHAAEASSGEEALRMFAEEPFDLVVTDMMMPGMNGHELGEALHRIAPELPVIYVSGYAQNILEHQGQLTKGTALLEKPYSLKRLVRVAEEELWRRGRLARAAQIDAD